MSVTSNIPLLWHGASNFMFKIKQKRLET